ncbi:hypothetical protein QM467_05780 [Rhodoblastus sp. 17X3]|uniref:hypothetical protein n=1 Tax=Rhodoblastus sp. 17X3 TaxID=3047026 RepID=UPI0024B748FE|nr:hypothetical protein [Rhodoblastus sp. 17X3]MDI9847570.1 hypothetical protein [Rhodoblastus sp. 17X3]
MNLARLLLAGALALALCAAAQAQTANPIVSDYVAVTSSPTALPARSLASGVIVRADKNNVGTVYVGGAADAANSARWSPLAAGEAMSFGVTNLNQVATYGTITTDVLRFSGN